MDTRYTCALKEGWVTSTRLMHGPVSGLIHWTHLIVQKILTGVKTLVLAVETVLMSIEMVISMLPRDTQTQKNTLSEPQKTGSQRETGFGAQGQFLE